MTEIKINTNSQGVNHMKKTLLVAALATVLVFAFATTAFAIGPFFSTAYDNNNTGEFVTGTYLDWDAAALFPGNTGTSPHGGYTANTNKCAVCHSVHTATDPLNSPGASLLTAFGPYTTYAQGCVYCHGVGNTFTDVIITANPNGYISPHGSCTRCHALNPHAVGASVYPTLASKLINQSADDEIAHDLGTGDNGLVADMFDGTPSLNDAGITLGTGYLCANCHSQSFAVNTAGSDPYGGGDFTGHRVTAMATTNWAAPGGANSLANNTQIAWKNANGCEKCHSALDSTGDTAFPHGYVNSVGAVTPKTVAGSSFIWLTLASDALASEQVLEKVIPETGDGNANLLTEDGLCLKCHRSGTGTGVGLTF